MGVSHSVFLSFKEGADEDAIQEFWDKLDEFPTMKPGAASLDLGEARGLLPHLQRRVPPRLLGGGGLARGDGRLREAPVPHGGGGADGSDHRGRARDGLRVHLDPAERGRLPSAARGGRRCRHRARDDAGLQGRREARRTSRSSRSRSTASPVRSRSSGAGSWGSRGRTTAQRQIGSTSPSSQRWTRSRRWRAYAAHPYHTEVVGPMLGPIMKDVLVVDFAFSRVIESAVDYAQIIPYR